MAPPLQPPLAPQLARPAPELPDGDGWWYEPKWDGFRAIAFVDGGLTALQSRNGKPLERYFPEIAFPPGRYVVDGEIIIPGLDGGQEFGALQQRIHPAASRIERLSREMPAVFVAFDLLALDDASLLEQPHAERRARLEALVADPMRLTPGTADRAEAARLLEGAGEGGVAKRGDAPYRPGERTGMVKVKRVRTFDCVVVGWRPGKAGEDTVGSLILGMYEPGDRLRVVGHAAGFRAAQKRELRGLVRAYETGERGTADPSRWSADRELEWVALRPELVVEVRADQVSDGRIRHGARLVGVREDRDPLSCGTDQLSG